MKKLYTEIQYREYLKLMDRMANCDDIIKGAYIHEEINKWLIDNHISIEIEEQMNKRMEKECEDEMNGVKKEGKVIKFPKE